MTLTATRIRDLLAAHDLRPSKALGQHFLADPNTARRIVRLAGVEPGDRVVEVGPGVGSLTVALLDAGARVTALELDRHIVPVLTEVTAGRAIDIVVGDALTVDWSALLSDRGWSMVANLPYNVGTNLLLRALETAPMIDRFLVMVQREVGERLAAGVGDSAYGAVSVKTAWYATARVVGAAHAGWRGALTGVIEGTLAAMEQLGAVRGRIVAAAGPMIQQRNYEVGPDLIERFRSAGPDNDRFFAPAERPGHALFDLPGFIVARLRQAGVAQVWRRCQPVA